MDEAPIWVDAEERSLTSVRLLVASVVLTMLAGACGSEGDPVGVGDAPSTTKPPSSAIEATTTTATPTTTTAPATTTTATPTTVPEPPSEVLIPPRVPVLEGDRPLNPLHNPDPVGAAASAEPGEECIYGCIEAGPVDEDAWAQWSKTLVGSTLCVTRELTWKGQWTANRSDVGDATQEWIEWSEAQTRFPTFVTLLDSASLPFHAAPLFDYHFGPSEDCDATISIVLTGETLGAEYSGCTDRQYTGASVKGSVELTAPDQPVLATQVSGIDDFEPTLGGCNYNNPFLDSYLVDLAVTAGLENLGILRGNGPYFPTER